MSAELDYRKILSQRFDGEQKVETTSPPIPQLYQPLDTDNSKKDNNRRYYPSLSGKPASSIEPPLILKNVRRFEGSIPQGIIQKPTTRRIVKRGIVVNAVRPYSARTRSTCYWHDTGWEKRGPYLIGHYSVGRKLFPGSIELKDSVVVPAKYYIYDPPYEVMTGPHSVCFRRKGEVDGKEKYWIHFSREPSDIDCGIIQIERDLADAVGE